MEIENEIRIKSRKDLRDWLEIHSVTEKYCWVIISKMEGTDVVQYLDIVEEALCFGWIDGIKKKITDTEVAQRLSPRKKKSNWTELNIEGWTNLLKTLE